MCDPAAFLHLTVHVISHPAPGAVRLEPARLYLMPHQNIHQFRINPTRPAVIAHTVRDVIIRPVHIRHGQYSVVRACVLRVAYRYNRVRFVFGQLVEPPQLALRVQQPLALYRFVHIQARPRHLVHVRPHIVEILGREPDPVIVIEQRLVVLVQRRHRNKRRSLVVVVLTLNPTYHVVYRPARRDVNLFTTVELTRFQVVRVLHPQVRQPFRVHRLLDTRHQVVRVQNAVTPGRARQGRVYRPARHGLKPFRVAQIYVRILKRHALDFRTREYLSPVIFVVVHNDLVQTLKYRTRQTAGVRGDQIVFFREQPHQHRDKKYSAGRLA